MSQSLREKELLDRFLEDSNLFLSPDKEIVYDHGLAAITEREQDAISTVSATTISLVRSKLQAAANETAEMLKQIGVAPGAKWGDLTAGIYTARGDLSLASSMGVPGFSTVTQYAVKFIDKYWTKDTSVGVKPGDAFMHNDARYGGIHNADHSMILPIFHEGELIAWAGTVVHEGENGAVEPGGIPSAAESKFMEGLCLSPIKVAENYTLKKDLVTFMQNSVRDPKLQLQDMKAKLTAGLRLKKRIEEAVKEFGVEAFIATVRKTLDDTVEEVKRRISKWPDGTVRSLSIQDGTLRENVLIKGQLEVTKKGDHLHFDLTGSSPEFANRSNNVPIIGLMAITSSYFLHYVWPDLPRNQAVLAPMKFTVSYKSIYDSSYETPNAQSLVAMFSIFTATQMAIAKFLYSAEEKTTNVVAPWYNIIATFLFGGVTQNGSAAANIGADLNAMPGGAKPDCDGEHSLVPMFGTMADHGEQELFEEELPMLQLSRKIMRDNQGFGKFRGGNGHQMIVTSKDSPLWGLMATSYGSKFPSVYGLFGGYGCPAYPLAKVKNINVFDILKNQPDKMAYTIEEIMNNRPFEGATYSTHHRGMQFEVVQEGEVYIITQGAGGGYGDVLDRDPELIMKDIEEDLISAEVAENVYHVVYDPQTLIVDRKATEHKRQQEREKRRQLGVPFDQFVKEWNTEEPPSHLPWYGSWGDKTVVYAGSPQNKMAADQLQGVFLPDPKDVLIAELQAKLETALNRK